MSRDSRLSGVLHVLMHMALEPGPHTSANLALAMNTNPVVIRRMMAGLRERGLVNAERGKGGGWSLACDCTGITLRDVYAALGHPSAIALCNRSRTPVCAMEQAVNTALNDAFDAAEAVLIERFNQITLADLNKTCAAGQSSCGNNHEPRTIHEAANTSG